MGMDRTIQNGYEPTTTADVTADVTPLDATSAGYTYDESDRPSNIWAAGEECNAVEMYFTGSDSTANTDVFSAKIYGYGRSGPAEFIADISGTAGGAYMNDVSTNLFVDTLVIDSQAHIKDVQVSDSANNRMAKLAFDFVGLKYLYVEFYDVSNGHRAWVRSF